MAISCKIVTVFLGRNTINYNFPHNTNKETNKVSLSIFVKVHGKGWQLVLALLASNLIMWIK